MAPTSTDNAEKKSYVITVLIDNPKSWFLPYGHRLVQLLAERGHDVCLVTSANELRSGDIAFFLACEKVVGSELRSRNKHNLVVHASALPKGKGWSPVTWQVLEGATEIPVTLFEAADAVDAGDVYAAETIHLDGHELVDELREKQASATFRLALQFVDASPPRIGRRQEGESTYHPRRHPPDSELDPNKSIVDLFNLLRVVDNERYPAFFKHRGHTYRLEIHKQR